MVDAILRKPHTVAMWRLAAYDVHPGCVQVLSVTAKGRLPQASVTLMGSGLMEWSRERDRVINVSAGQSAKCSNVLPSSTINQMLQHLCGHELSAAV